MGCPAPGRKETTRGSGAARSRNRHECSTGRTCGPVPRRSHHPEAGAGPKQPDPHPARPQPRTVVEIADVRVVEIGHGLRHGEQAATATPRPPLRHHFATAPPVGPCLCASSREKWPVRGGAGAWWGRGLREAPPTAPAAPPTCSGAASGGTKPSGLLNEPSKDEGCSPTGVQIHRNGVLYGMEPVGVHIHSDVAPLGLGLCGVKTHGWSSMGMRTQGCIPMGI